LIYKSAMTPAETTFLSRLREDPEANVPRLAREVGISNRLARRLVAQATGKRSRTRSITALVGLVALGAGALAFALTRERRGVARTEDGPRASEDVVRERDLYGALDRGDRTQVAEAQAQLASSDEGVRLAALRYLAGLGGADQGSLLARLVDDPSERVRAAAVQLLGGIPGVEIDRALLRVAGSVERPLAERLLALTAIQGRELSVRSEAIDALRALGGDPSPALREESARALRRLEAE
jgi:hypothetical protein